MLRTEDRQASFFDGYLTRHVPDDHPLVRAVKRVNGKAARALEGRYLNDQRQRGKASEEDLVREVELGQELVEALKGHRLGPKVTAELEQLQRVLDPEKKLSLACRVARVAGSSLM